VALIKCYECGSDVSTEAASCPHCGAPRRPPAQTKRSTVGRGLLIGGAILVGGFILTHWLSSGSDSVPQVSAKQQTPIASAIQAEPAPEHISAPLNDPKAITAEMSVRIVPGNPPSFIGKTNLPDGTLLAIFLKGDMPTCYPRCGFFATRPTFVKDGAFAVGPELTGNDQLIPDTHTIEITVYSGSGVQPGGGVQPREADAILGRHGEHLRGPHIFSMPGKELEPVSFPWNPVPGSNEAFGGLIFHFTQRMSVTLDDAFGVGPGNTNP
jgi:hypothetical protein